MDMQMKWNYLSFKVNENWIDFEINGVWSKKVVIKYNGDPVLTEKIGLLVSRRVFEFEVEEEQSNVHYSIELRPVRQLLSFIVFRDGKPIIVTNKDRKMVPRDFDIDSPAICYEVKDAGKLAAAVVLERAASSEPGGRNFGIDYRDP